LVVIFGETRAREGEMILRKKVKYRIGDAINTSLLPCRTCGDRHAETVMELKDGKPYMTSWASSKGKGHPLREVDKNEYIQEQRDMINKLLRERRLRRK